MLYEIFQGNEESVGRCQLLEFDEIKNKRNAKVWTEQRKPTTEDFEKHLSGEIGVGVSPITKDGYCTWGAIDVDDYNLDIEYISKQWLDKPWFFCTTKSGGVHIYVFFKSRIKAGKVQSTLMQMATLMGFGEPEIFPKQKFLKEGQTGNWINLPYFNNGSDRYCVYNGVRLSLDQFIEKVNLHKINDVKKLLHDNFDFPEAPPCIQKIVSTGIAQGNRSIALLNVGRYLKLRYPENWIDYIKKFNKEKLTPEFTQKELDVVLKSLKKDYKYACSGALAPYCSKTLCLSREYGVSKQVTIETFLTHIIKVETKPPYYRLVIEVGDDIHKVDCTSAELLSSTSVRQMVFEITNVLLYPMENAHYIKFINELMEKADIQKAPIDATATGDIESYIVQFFKDRRRDDINEVLRGQAVVIEEENVIVFKPNFLIEFLKNHGYRNIRRNDLFKTLKTLGASNDIVKTLEDEKGNKKSERLWAIPIIEDVKDKEIHIAPIDWRKHDTTIF